MAKKVMLSFTGNKEELHIQLKVWCAKAKKKVNGTVLELIEEHLKKEQKKEKKQ